MAAVRPTVNSDLIAAAQKGDIVAWRRLIESSQSRLFRFCVVLCGDPLRAEDLCQEAFLRAFASLDQLKDSQSFMDWLFRMTRNLFIDGLRKAREIPTTAEAVEESAGPEFQEHLAVHQTLSQFEPEDRLLLLLVDMEGHSYGEAAEILGATEAAVRSRLFRLRREFLEKWRGGETK